MDITTICLYAEMLIVTIFVIVAAQVYFTGVRFVKAEPNEWMLILRNGKPIRMGIGISGWAWWNDTVVRFPSQINKVSFSMDQVTTENQGVRISGVLLWSIYREEEGPFLAFQKLGEDLNTGNPAKANDDLRDTTFSLLREKVANSTIMKIVKQRNKIRDEMKKELNSLVNNWGVWVENVEICEVQILSKTLFKNLQTPHREEMRQKSEMIQMEVQKDIDLIRTKLDLEYLEKTEQKKTKIAVAQTEKGIILQTEDQKVYDHDMELEQKKNDKRKDCNLQKKGYEYKYYAERNQSDAELQQLRHEKDMIYKQEEHSNKMYKVETQKMETEASNKIKQADRDFDNEIKVKKMQVEEAALTEKVLQWKTLETVTDIYRSLPAQDVRLVQFDEDQGKSAIMPLAQAIQSLDVVKETITQ